MKITQTFLAFIMLLISAQVQGQEDKAPILFIYDASGSMWGQMEGKTKMAIASDVLSKTIQTLPENQAIGLMAYGHRKKGDCDDVEILVNLENQDKVSITNPLTKIKPLGRTPLAKSALLAIDQLRATKQAATIILITDGIESCNGDLCAVVTKAKAEGIDFKLHIIGFGLADEDLQNLKCAAQAGEGNYYDADDTASLSDVLNEATNATIDEPAGNFSVYATKNGKVVDAFVQAYQAGTKERVTAARSYQDSAWLFLPAGEYDLEVRPIAGDVGSTSVRVTSKGTIGGHQDISFDAAKFVVQTFNNEENWDATLRVIDPKTQKVVAVKRTYGEVREIEIGPGTYHINFLAQKIKGYTKEHRLENITIQAGEKKPIQHVFRSGEVLIGAMIGAELVDALVVFKDAKTGKSIDSSRTYKSASTNPRSFILSPGTYDVSIRLLGKQKGKKDGFQITVESGKKVERIIQF